MEPFTITPVPADKMLRITLRGHWTVDTVDRYRTAMITAARALIAADCPREDIIALVDTREQGAQSQDVVARFKQMLGGDGFAPRRLATLVTSALFRRQVERIGVANQRLFTDEAEALAWLLSPDSAS